MSDREMWPNEQDNRGPWAAPSTEPAAAGGGDETAAVPAQTSNEPASEPSWPSSTAQPGQDRPYGYGGQPAGHQGGEGYADRGYADQSYADPAAGPDLATPKGSTANLLPAPPRMARELTRRRRRVGAPTAKPATASPLMGNRPMAVNLHAASLRTPNPVRLPTARPLTGNRLVPARPMASPLTASPVRAAALRFAWRPEHGGSPGRSRVLRSAAAILVAAAAVAEGASL